MYIASNLIVDIYEKYYLNPLFNYNNLGNFENPFPKITSDTLISVCESAITSLSKKDTLLRLTGPINIIGDLHGNIRDLLRIFSLMGDPSETQYLFLGDYVDRGEFSIEVVSLLFALVSKYPHNIHLLRGNHEFKIVNSHYGLQEQVLLEFGSLEIWERINEVFSYLSLVAIINNKVFCVHGGLSQHFESLRAIKNIKRPLPDYPLNRVGLLLTDLMWSDPDSSIDLFGPSSRGNGCHFGSDSVISFLNQIKCNLLIRAHQFIPEGYSSFAEGKCITVFSSTNYKENIIGKCGIINIQLNGSLQTYFLNSLDPIYRKDMKFLLISFEDTLINRNALKVIIPINPRNRRISSRQIPPQLNSIPLLPQFKSPSPLPSRYSFSGQLPIIIKPQREKSISQNILPCINENESDVLFNNHSLKLKIPKLI